MKNIVVCCAMAMFLLTSISYVSAASDDEIREIYRQVSNGHEMTPEQKSIISTLSNKEKRRFYHEALQEDLDQRGETPTAKDRDKSLKAKLDAVTKEQERVKKMPKKKFVF